MIEPKDFLNANITTDKAKVVLYFNDEIFDNLFIEWKHIRNKRIDFINRIIDILHNKCFGEPGLIILRHPDGRTSGFNIEIKEHD